MRIAAILIVLFIIFTSCNKSHNAVDIVLKINKKIAEIHEIIGNAESTESMDCRIYYTPSGHGCGPFFIFNIKAVDSVLLYRKFNELSKLNQDYYNTGKMPVCDLLLADSLILVNGKCKECYIDSTLKTYDQFVNQKILELQRKPKGSTPAELWKWEYNYIQYYYIPRNGSNVSGELYSLEGDLICHPDKETIGAGNEKCPKLVRDSIIYTLIWKDNR